MDTTAALYYAPSIAGLVMVVGGMVLLYKEKIYIDRETSKVIEVETPVGKFKTNIPALVLFVLGFVPMLLPLYWAKTAASVRHVKVRGPVISTRPTTVYAAIRQDALQTSRDFSMNVPVVNDPDNEYLIVYVSGDVVRSQPVDLAAAKNDTIVVEAWELDPSPQVPVTKPEIHTVDAAKFK